MDKNESEYRARERAAIEHLAVSTLSDPKATHDDRREARRRLEGDGTRDVSTFTDDELIVAAWVHERARGIASSSTRGEVAAAALNLARTLALEPDTTASAWRRDSATADNFALNRAQVAIMAMRLADDIELQLEREVAGSST
jgi:hypothetical protein